MILNGENTASIADLAAAELLRIEFALGFAAADNAADSPPCFDAESAAMRAYRLGLKVGWMMRGEVALDEDMAPLLDLFREG